MLTSGSLFLNAVIMQRYVDRCDVIAGLSKVDTAHACILDAGLTDALLKLQSEHSEAKV